MTKELKQKLQVFVNKCLRSILRIWRPRRIRNDELWRQTGQRPIEEEIRERAWRWIGHTLRRPDGHVAKTVLEWNPQGKRKRGRPRHTLKGTRMLELEERGLTWREAKVKIESGTKKTDDDDDAVKGYHECPFTVRTGEAFIL